MSAAKNLDHYEHLTIGLFMQTRARRKYTQEFRDEAVRLAQDSVHIAAVACNLDLDVSTLRDWIRRANHPASDSTSLTASERQEQLQLPKDNAVLRMEWDILKKAAAFVCHERAR